MVHTTLTIGPEETDALIDISMETEAIAKARKSFTILFIVLAALLLVLGFLESNAVFYVSAAVAALIGVFGVRPLQKIGARRAYAKADDRVTSGVRTYVFSEEGVAVESEIGRGVTEWSAFTKRGEQGRYLWLRRADNQVIMVDMGKLTSEELSELRALVARVPE